MVVGTTVLLAGVVSPGVCLSQQGNAILAAFFPVLPFESTQGLPAVSVLTSISTALPV